MPVQRRPQPRQAGDRGRCLPEPGAGGGHAARSWPRNSSGGPAARGAGGRVAGWYPRACQPPAPPRRSTRTPRWPGAAGGAECLDWLLVVGRGHLEQVLGDYVEHYNRHRPHRALGLEPPDPSAALTALAKLNPVGSIGVTCWTVSDASTGELHERLYAPHRLPAPRTAVGWLGRCGRKQVDDRERGRPDGYRHRRRANVGRNRHRPNPPRAGEPPGCRRYRLWRSVPGPSDQPLQGRPAGWSSRPPSRDLTAPPGP